MTNDPVRDGDFGSSCVSVTALEVLQFSHGTFIFSGSGGSLCLREISHPQRISTCEVFVDQAIHGIKAHGEQSNSALVLAWGGRSVSCCEIDLRTDDVSRSLVNTKISKIWSQDLDDWVLDLKFVGDGSMAIALTAHNAVYRIPLHNVKRPNSNLLCDGLQTMLYSGSITALDENAFLIASGTVFGEIFVWSCSQFGEKSQWVAQIRHVYTAHRGSIFGVSISKPILWQGSYRRLLASCSDDRTIRIWDVSADASDRILNTINSTGHSTGFGGIASADASLAMAWGHLSRIWHVTFLQNEMQAGDDDLALMSFGEDGVSQYWSLNKTSIFTRNPAQKISLSPIYHDRHHAGKNVWSWVECTVEDGFRIFTGGADGQIIARSFRTPRLELENRSQRVSFRNVLSSVEVADQNTSGQPLKIGNALKQYLVLPDDEIIATTDTGVLLLGSLRDFAVWTTIFINQQQAVKVLCSNQHGQLGLFATSKNKIYAYDIASSTAIELRCELPAQIAWMQVAGSKRDEFNNGTTFWLVVTFHGHILPQILTILHTHERLTASANCVPIPSDFHVTCCHYDEQLDSLILGSRSGALAICNGFQPFPDAAEMVHCIRHAHGSDCVTSIMRLPQPAGLSSLNAWYLTTGRDGTYAVHLVSRTATELRPEFTTVHRSRLPLGPNIEGAYVRCDGVDAPSLILYGFRSTEFIVWDENHQKQLHTIDCGGAHRSWHFRRNNVGKGIGAFIWSQAGSVNGYKGSDRSCDIIQHGGHGREIKALAISNSNSLHGQVIATGAEDTDIRLFRYNKESHGFDCIRVLQGHSAGLQHLEYSRCGKYLFSSAGCEEMCVWQLYEVPVLGLGAVLLARLPKEAEDLDARIMSFDIVGDAGEGANKDVFRIALAYSNGKVKLFSYLASSQKLEFFEELFISMTCLSQARQQGGRFIVVGATDGVIRLVKHPEMAVAASSKIHQNNIAGMATLGLGRTHQLLVTGGDDSAVGLSVIRLDAQPRIRTTLIPDAHAAAATAVVILAVSKHEDCYTAFIASAGNDQKVKIWKAQIVLLPSAAKQDSQDEDGRYSCIIKAKRLMELWTDITDISSMEMMETRSMTPENGRRMTTYELLVAGVGMQILQIDMDGER